MSAWKNLCIVFLLLTAENSDPEQRVACRDRLFGLQTPRTAATSEPEALVNAAKFTAASPPIAGAAGQSDRVHNYLISKYYFLVSLSCDCLLQAGPAND
jgi:hypothetical protein